MTVLDGIDADVAAAIADIFKDGTHQFTGAMTSDGRGGQTRSTSTQAAKVLVTDYRDYVRATTGIPSNERKVMVQGFGMSPTPSPDDVIVQGEEAWQVVEVTKDPANAIYTCRCRPVAVPSGIVPVLLLAAAEAQAEAFSGLEFAYGVHVPATSIADIGSDLSVGFDLNDPAIAVAHPSSHVVTGVNISASAEAVAVVNSSVALFNGVVLNTPAIAISEAGSTILITATVDAPAQAVASAKPGVIRGFGITAPVVSEGRVRASAIVSHLLDSPATADAESQSQIRIALKASASVSAIAIASGLVEIGASFIVDHDFSSDPGYIFSGGANISGGVLNLPSPNDNARFLFPSTVGNDYRIRLDISGLNGGQFIIYMGTWSSGTVGSVHTVSADGPVDVTLTMHNNYAGFRVLKTATSGGTVDNITVEDA